MATFKLATHVSTKVRRDATKELSIVESLEKRKKGKGVFYIPLVKSTEKFRFIKHVSQSLEVWKQRWTKLKSSVKFKKEPCKLAKKQ